MKSVFLKWALLVGSIYFLAVSIAHFVGIKVPMLFIYYNIPSYTFQDRIISFFSFGWSVFFFIAGRNPSDQSKLIKGILYVGLVAIISLCMINYSTDFNALEAAAEPTIYWIETGVLAIYLTLITGLKISIQLNHKD